MWEVDAPLAKPTARCTVRAGGGGGGKKSRGAATVPGVTVRHTALSHGGGHLVGVSDEGSVYVWSLGAAAGRLCADE